MRTRSARDTALVMLIFTRCCSWVQAKAARQLKIKPRQMGCALQKHGIEGRKF